MDYRTSWRRVRDFFGALLCTFALLRSLTTSAKTVHRTVFFRRLRMLPPCSNPLFVLPKQKAGLATCFSFWRRVRDFFGVLPCTFASLRSLTTSAKTVHRTVFFRRLRLLPPCSNPLFVLPKQKAGLATCFSLWRRVRDSNPRYITYTAFRVLHLRPLGQLSVFQFVATCPITYRNVYYTKHFYTCQ